MALKRITEVGENDEGLQRREEIQRKQAVQETRQTENMGSNEILISF